MAVKFVASSPKSAPAVGSTYRFIGVPGATLGNISLKIGRRVWNGSSIDKARLAMNNVFTTIQQAREARRAVAKVFGLTVKKVRA